jgi:hypothetical protein
MDVTLMMMVLDLRLMYGIDWTGRMETECKRYELASNLMELRVEIISAYL